MTDEPRMVDLPWHDGTMREVPELTVYAASDGALYTARAGGYSEGIDPSMSRGRTIYPHDPASAAVRVFTEAPEPPVKVSVPTGIAAILSLPTSPSVPGYVLTHEGWRGLRSNVKIDPDEIANKLRNGAKVLFEGVDG